MSLPDELLLRCIARVSRLYYPTLSRVSKSFRALVVKSAELYKTRSLIGSSESCLYVCFDLYPTCCWFTLCRKPDETLKNNKGKKSTTYVLSKVPIRGYPPPRCWSSNLVAVGSYIYNFAGTIEQNRYPSVWILNCMNHTWRLGPSLPRELMSLCASVVDGKIYVAGRCQDGSSDILKNSVEVLDTGTQTWDGVTIPCSDIEYSVRSKSACIDRKFHLETEDSEVVAYNSEKGKWDRAEKGVRHYMYSDSYCEIDNVVYAVYGGEFSWYDVQVQEWIELEGLVGLPTFPDGACVRLGDYGGKLAVLWDEKVSRKKLIWCAVVALERRDCGEICGTVEWFDQVLTVPVSCDLLKVVSATV